MACRVVTSSATVKKGITANINAGNKRIRKAVPYKITGKE